MRSVIHIVTKSNEFSNRDFRNASFKGQDLSGQRFNGCDLRGTDFTDANLYRVDFSHVKTGIPPVTRTILFFAALLVSLAAGYLAMLAGKTIQHMVGSEDENIIRAGYITMAIVILFLLFSMWKGVGRAIITLFAPAAVLAVIVGTLAYYSGMGTGMGMVFLVASLVLIAVMFIIGTMARAAAGTLSNLLFTIVAISGALFSKTLGGGAGTALMALACVVISKRALAGAKGFDILRRFGAYITIRFGTSFRNSTLSNANFSDASLHNADFSDAEISGIDWSNSKKINCVF